VFKTKAENLLKNGEPKYIQIYCYKKSKCADRWTVVFSRAMCWVSDDKRVKEMYRGRHLYIGMTDSGSIYHGELDLLQCKNGLPSYGSRMKWSDLNLPQKEAVIAEYEACWDVTITHFNGVCSKIWRNAKEKNAAA